MKEEAEGKDRWAVGDCRKRLLGLDDSKASSNEAMYVRLRWCPVLPPPELGPMASEKRGPALSGELMREAVRAG